MSSSHPKPAHQGGPDSCGELSKCLESDVGDATAGCDGSATPQCPSTIARTKNATTGHIPREPRLVLRRKSILHPAVLVTLDIVPSPWTGAFSRK